MYLTATVVGEIAAGIAILPEGKKRQVLELWQDELCHVAFAGRILPFDTEAALAYAQMIAQARRTGRPAHIEDAQIAAVALVHGLTVTTRDAADFAGFGVALVNPFEDT